MNEVFYGLAWLLLPSSVPDVDAAALPRVSHLAVSDRLVLAQTEEILRARNKSTTGVKGRSTATHIIHRQDGLDPDDMTTTPRSPAPPKDAVIESRPDLVHPAFTTYLFSVTVPCVIGWVIVTWLCLWICRPHSPLYREILKRLIEHSQMKQKSVLFAATVLAGERKPPEEPEEGTTSTTKK